MGLYPPDDPFLINTTIPLAVVILLIGGVVGAMASSWIFPKKPNNATSPQDWKQWGMGLGIGVLLALGGLFLTSPANPMLGTAAVPVQIRWYGVFIVSGAMIATTIAAHRAKQRGYHPDHAWNQLMLGLVFGIIGARSYYVIFEWDQFQGQIGKMINITTGGLAIHGAIIGALLAVFSYTRYHRLRFWEWMDIQVPGFLLAQGIGRWGNFFNQEAYGSPTTLGFGVKIDPAYRLPPYHNTQRYPADMLFHPTFLYESVWNITGVGMLLLLERYFGPHAPRVKRWMRYGDTLFVYCIYYSLGRFWIEGLRTDSLYVGELRTAQMVSLAMVGVGVVGLLINHTRRLSPAEKLWQAEQGGEPEGHSNV